MRAFYTSLSLLAAVCLSFAAPPTASIIALQDKSCAIAIVGVDGHPIKAPQQKISVSPGHHTLLLRISPAAYPTFSNNITLPDQTFEANGRYSVKGVFTPSTGRLGVEFSDEKKRPRSK
jgi:hypothetical protein